MGLISLALMSSYRAPWSKSYILYTLLQTAILQIQEDACKPTFFMQKNVWREQSAGSRYEVVNVLMAQICVRVTSSSPPAASEAWLLLLAETSTWLRFANSSLNKIRAVSICLPQSDEALMLFMSCVYMLMFSGVLVGWMLFAVKWLLPFQNEGCSLQYNSHHVQVSCPCRDLVCIPNVTHCPMKSPRTCHWCRKESERRELSSPDKVMSMTCIL